MFEDERIVNTDLFSNFLIHGVYISLIDSHTLFGQRGRIVDGYVMQLWMS